MDLENRLRDKLESIPISKILILGVGNSLKADDGVGPFICGQLKPVLGNQVMDGGTAPENYIQKILEFSPDLLLIIDATDFGGKPGQVRLFEQAEFRSGASSTHALDPRTFMDLVGRECGTDFSYIGIQPEDLTMGQPMTATMKTAAGQCIQSITAVLSP